MKKLLLGALLLLSISVFSQNDLKFLEVNDEVGGKEYVIISKTLLCSEDGVKGFIIEPHFNKKTGVIQYSTISIKFAHIGNCNENDGLIFLFEDGSRVEMRSWSKFDCKGVSYFDLRGNELQKLNKPIKAVRFTNGRSHESYTYFCKTDFEKNYFIYVNKLLNK
jgi:hypothetical protein